MVRKLDELDRAGLDAERERLRRRYEEIRARGLDLDMTRGKPSPEQLDLAAAMLDLPGRNRFTDADGVDCRNYGGLEGLRELRELFGDILEVDPELVLVGGNSSLTLMHEMLMRALVFGVPGGDAPWSECMERAFLCPSPGYDRHFLITEHLGFRLVPVAMTDTGPDMDEVEAHVAENASVKGIWCVPRYSNPTGATYSEATVQRLAGMPAAADFRIVWDNAYAEHHLVESPQPLANIFRACADAGHPDRPWLFASTSKMSFAGAGVSAVASSRANIDDLRRHLGVQSIGPDKINQLRHALFFGGLAGLREHMRRHATLIRPKFEQVARTLEAELGASGVAQWTTPEGGYFVSVDVEEGAARRVIDLAAGAGVRLTAAGAAFPCGKDPRDRNIRIAPTFPRLEDVGAAMEVLCVCILLDAVERRLA